LGEENHMTRIKDNWTLQEMIKLLKYVQKRVGKVFLSDDVMDLLDEEKQLEELYEDDPLRRNIKRKRKDLVNEHMVSF
jgi:hypothetical protein